MSSSSQPNKKTKLENGNGSSVSYPEFASEEFKIKSGLARMLVRGVIMDVINVEQALIAQEAGACAVMALERVPADIRAGNFTTIIYNCINKK